MKDTDEDLHEPGSPIDFASALGEAAERLEGDQDRAEADEPVDAPIEDGVPSDPDRPWEVPDYWPDEARTAFEGLDEQTRNAALPVLQNLKFDDYPTVREQWQGVEKALEPYKSVLEASGVSPIDAVSRWVSAQRLLDQNPAQGIQWLMKSYGVGPEHLGIQPVQPQPTEPWAGDDFSFDDDGNIITPAPQPAVDPLTQMRIQNLESYLAQQQQAEVARLRAQADREQQEFAEAKDDSGKPKYPHFDSVKQRMAQIYQMDAARGMQQARPMADVYEEAVWAEPSVREKLIADREKQIAKQRDAERRKEVKSSKDAASVNARSRSTPTEPAKAPVKNWREAIEKTADALQANS